jgi:two-component system response regulator FixJ
MLINMFSADPTVFIIDDDPAIREALSCLMQSVFLNVETYQDAQTYLQDYNSKRYGCLLIDIRMPTMSGFELLEQLNKKHNHIPVIFLTGHGDVPMAVRAMQAGAVDFILKPFNHQVLLEKVQKAIAISKVQHSSSGSDVLINRSKLTKRENEVLELIIACKSNKQIAFELNISYYTVEFHRANLMRKLQVKSIAALMKTYLLYSNTPGNQ